MPVIRLLKGQACVSGTRSGGRWKKVEVKSGCRGNEVKKRRCDE